MNCWYASGLNFTCKRCSACCRYDAGFVYLSVLDLDKLAARMELDKEKFIGLYCRWVDSWNGNETLSLREKANKDCIFWESSNEGSGCTVYDDRPLQCRTFPFWENILSSKDSWNMAAGNCPGMNEGRIHTKDEIESLLEESSSYNYIKRERGA